ncbi:amino acid ABC transporter permease [Microbacterium sp.]|uniref:amino acid ABC transporter permease n=1 Tax=Microbacterium sp. TaxID=51671 RepID=UPI00351CBC67
MEQLASLMPVFWEGFRVTLLLLAVSGVLALVIGTVIAAMRISPVGSLRVFGAVWTEIARNTPLTLVFFFFAFIVPFLGVRLPYVVLAIFALTYYTSPFVAEALRSGINGVPVGQAEAARSIGLGFGQTVTLVVLPQAFRMTIPPLITVFIALTKNTSVAGGFFVAELFASTRELANANGNIVIPILLLTAALYLVVTVPLGLFAGQLEKRVVMGR